VLWLVNREGIKGKFGLSAFGDSGLADWTPDLFAPIPEAPCRSASVALGDVVFGVALGNLVGKFGV